MPSKNCGLAIYWGKTFVKHVFDKGSEYKKNILKYVSSCKLPTNRSRYERPNGENY